MILYFCIKAFYVLLSARRVFYLAPVKSSLRRIILRLLNDTLSQEENKRSREENVIFHFNWLMLAIYTVLQVDEEMREMKTF